MNHSPLTTEHLDALRKLHSSTLANAIETFHRRLRNEGFMDASVHCLFPSLPPMVGYAATITIRGSAPPTTNGPYPDRTDWWDYVLTIPAPRILVIQDVAAKPGLGSLIGAVHMNILKALGCVGVVTNGSVRDLPASEKAGFHLFAGGVSVSHAYVHIIEFGNPVEVAGLHIQSGNLLHGDLHGVQCVPTDIAPEIPARAEQIAVREKELIDICRSSDFSLDRLRGAIARQHS